MAQQPPRVPDLGRATACRRWQFDPSAWVIWALEKIGLAWDVVRIAPERQAAQGSSAAERDATTAPLREALAEALPDRPFRIELWDGTSLPVDQRRRRPDVHRPLARARSRHVLRAPGQLGLGRAYVRGELEVDDIDAALDAARHLEAAADRPRAKATARARPPCARPGCDAAAQAARGGAAPDAAGATASCATSARSATTTTSPTSSSRSSSTSR